MEHDDQYTLNAIKLTVLSAAQNWIFLQMKGQLNQRSKMLLNQALHSSNRLIKHMENGFDETAENACDDLAYEILEIIEVMLKTKNGNDLIKLIKAYNNGEIQIVNRD